jgi:predicted MFS family arabinose efflux permease
LGFVTAAGTKSDVRQGVRQRLPGLLSLALASCLAVTTEMLPVGLLPSIGNAFGVAASTTGLVVSLYAVMVAALSVPLTLATTRFARKPLLQTTLLCYGLSNTIVAVAPTFAVLVAGRTLGGITHALFFSLCIGYVPRLVHSAEVGLALAVATGGASAGFVLGVPLSTSLGTALGWRTPFAALAAVAMLTMLLVARLLPAVTSTQLPQPSENTSRRRELAAVVTSNALVYLGQFTLYTFISVLLLQSGAGPASIGPILLVCGGCGLVGLWFAGSMMDRRPRRTIMIVLSIVIAAVALIGIAIPALVPVVIAAAVWNGAFGGVPSIYQTCAVRALADSPELAGAWLNAASNVGIAGGSALGAALLPAIGLSWLPWVAVALITIGLSLSMLARQAFPSRP